MCHLYEQRSDAKAAIHHQSLRPVSSHFLSSNNLGRPPQHLLFSLCSFYNKTVLFLRSTPQTLRFSSRNGHINAVLLSCSTSAMPSCSAGRPVIVTAAGTGRRRPRGDAELRPELAEVLCCSHRSDQRSTAEAVTLCRCGIKWTEEKLIIVVLHN